jgi:rubrerythrin
MGDNSEMLDGLREALKAERTGSVFYRTAAATTKDPLAKTVFEAMAKEEDAHFEFLRAQYRSLAETGNFATGLTLGDQAHVDRDSAIFSPELRAKIRGAHFEMSALNIAVQLEVSSVNRYRELAAKATVPAAKKFFSELVEWEQDHCDSLLRQQKELDEEYWASVGFAPT